MVARWIADVSRLSRRQGASSTPSCMSLEMTPGSVGPDHSGFLWGFPRNCSSLNAAFHARWQNAGHSSGLLPSRNGSRYTALAGFAAHLCTGDSHMGVQYQPRQ